MLVIEYKPWWVVNLVRIHAAFNGTDSGPIANQTMEALHQVYGYMTFNHIRFGILTSWTHALFLRRAETSDRKCLEYYLVELEGASTPISMLKAWAGILLLASQNWHSGDLATSKAAHQKAVADAHGFNMSPSNGVYELGTLDFRICKFDLSSLRDGEIEGGSLVWGSLLRSDANTLDVVFKIVDACRYPDAAEILQGEANAYAALQALQGSVIPRVYGLYGVWGILDVLALQPVGDALGDEDKIDVPLLNKMKAAFQRVHDSGFLHGNINRRIFCQRKREVFLVDLKSCRKGTIAEREREMSEVDALV